MAALLGMVVPALALMTAPGLTRAPRRARVHASEATMAEGSGRDGHVFVVHGDVLSLSADAVLVPTRNLNNRKWFPDGPPANTTAPPRDAFTPSRRVIKTRDNVDGSGPSAGPAIWLGHLDGRFAPTTACDDSGRPRLAWFLEAAEQYLRAAREFSCLRTRGGRNDGMPAALRSPAPCSPLTRVIRPLPSWRRRRLGARGRLR